LIFDDVEGGSLMDIERYFGQKAAERIEAPNENGASTTVEEFYDNVTDALEGDKPFIYILDSLDGLSSEAELNKAQEDKVARRKGKDIGGSYGDGKAKKNSGGIRQIIGPLQKQGSILIVISQTRDNIGFGAQFNPKTRSGGNAPIFYATTQIWYSIKEKLKKTVNGKPRKIGILSKVDIKRNRITGREVSVDIPILYGHGIDDTGSMVQYLVDEKHWSEKAGKITADEFNLEGSAEKLIKEIENGKKTDQLKEIVKKVWKEIQIQCEAARTNKYK